MNDLSLAPRDVGAPASAFEFTGNWREFAPIALTNLLLTLVTLGIYRFWATTRERRYLWSRTRFIDDTLEWTGTGREMFIGFLIVMVIVLPAILFFQFGFQALILRGEGVAAGIIAAALYVALLYIGGLATFRALRYRLSRTLWHGIRGGSDDAGWGYAWSALWKTAVGFLALGLMVPWSMTRLWNERWGKMSFGPHAFAADAKAANLMGRWLLVMFSPGVLFFLLVAIGAGFVAASGIKLPELNPNDPTSAGAFMTIGFAVIFGAYALIGVIALIYYSAYYRTVVEATTLADLGFRFTARTKDWVGLILGTLGLVIVTLGVGLLFVGYRNWAFFIRHLEATGNIDPTTLTQSTVAGATDAEGLASMFDIGAI